MEPKMIEVNVYPNTKSPSLFKNKFVEKLTKTHPAVITSMYLVLCSLSIIYYHRNINPDWASIAIYFPAGILGWTLLEYLMHRFLYHKIGDATYSTGYHYTFHGIHHEYPHDKDRLVLPPLPSLIIASILFAIVYLIFGILAFLLAPGLLVGYLLYMNIHYMVHKVPMPKKFNFWWTYHSVHHYQQHDRAFGVSSPLWDWVFGTLPEKNRRTVVIRRKS